MHSVASFTLFGLMAAVRRPFEAHLFAYGHRQTSTEPTPPTSRRLSEDHTATEKLVPGMGMTAYNHTRSTSNFTNADVETLDLNASSRPPSIYDSPTRDRIGVFTSPFVPPPLPPAFMISVENSTASQRPTLDPFAHRRRISLTPRTDALLAPAAYVPHSIPIEYSASAQRAVFPDAAAPYRSINTSRSQPQLRSMSNFTNRHRYSRSSISLSRPHRLSSLTPVSHLECSSRSDTLNSSGGISETGESPNSKSGVGKDKRASATEIVYAINNNTAIPGTEQLSPRKHWRTVSAPDANAGAQQAKTGSDERMAMGWKPTLSNSKSSTLLRKPLPIAFNKLVRSASAELLGRFGPVASDDVVDKMVEFKWKREFEREIEDRLNDLHVLPFPDEEGDEERKSISIDADTLRGSYERNSLEDEMRFEDAKEVLNTGTRPVSRDIALV
ncbi:uncharacterized protein M421DRAFT_158303 [Didymella exigua CBS 183.55]|uniref:Uncharacterized protein n=1 Tax=Didymella exigua CBS 183.55 TaxID=1150837 RepID=A0A6A5RM19_9PLEO|nr:uncharacterized protein M421DRAFT_158303 [Didymella exigua CBS 183.55]KAF1928310.1 hypothetical protein M421DRAFT_158303 [Didymella exigua CBS 183.55]